jgi:hypothetical protein
VAVFEKEIDKILSDIRAFGFGLHKIS